MRYLEYSGNAAEGGTDSDINACNPSVIPSNMRLRAILRRVLRFSPMPVRMEAELGNSILEFV